MRPPVPPARAGGRWRPGWRTPRPWLREPPPAAARGLRLGMLRLPAETARRLNLVAQELGIASSEVIRRAVEVSLSPGV